MGSMNSSVGPIIVIPSATFTRPNDTSAYTSGDIVANSTTATAVQAMTWSNIARVAKGEQP